MEVKSRQQDPQQSLSRNSPFPPLQVTSGKGKPWDSNSKLSNARAPPTTSTTSPSMSASVHASVPLTPSILQTERSEVQSATSSPLSLQHFFRQGHLGWIGGFQHQPRLHWQPILLLLGVNCPPQARTLFSPFFFKQMAGCDYEMVHSYISVITFLKISIVKIFFASNDVKWHSKCTVKDETHISILASFHFFHLSTTQHLHFFPTKKYDCLICKLYQGNFKDSLTWWRVTDQSCFLSASSPSHCVIFRS